MAYADEAINVPILYPQIVIVDSNRAIIPSLNCLLEMDLRTQKTRILLALKKDVTAVPTVKELEKAKFPDMVKITYFNKSTNDLYFDWSAEWGYNSYRYNLASGDLEYLGIIKDLPLINQFRRYDVYNRSTKKFEQYFKATWKNEGIKRFDYALPNDTYSLDDPFLEKWQDDFIQCAGNDILILAYKIGIRDPYLYGYLVGEVQDTRVIITDLIVEFAIKDARPFTSFEPDIRDDMNYDPQVSPPFFAQIQEGSFYFMTAWKVQKFYDSKVGTGDDPESQAYRLITVNQYDRESREVKTVLTDVYDYTLPYSFYVLDGVIYYFKFNGFRKCATLYKKQLDK